MASFHVAQTNASIQATGASAWVYAYKSYRTVNYRFFAHYHP